MRKLKLNVEDLEVTSFRTGGEEEEKRGTVVGHKPPPPTYAFETCDCGDTYVGMYTCDWTCPASCQFGACATGQSDPCGGCDTTVC